jgi:alpha-1,3-rhamnosyl/mannosyltransferase
MACGRPVVGYRGGSVHEVIGDSGIVVETGDVEGLISAVERLLADGEYRSHLGQAARKRVSEEFNPRRSFEQLCRIYESVIGRKCGHHLDLAGKA